MSVDVFVQAFLNGQPQAVPTADVLACFEGFITKRHDSYFDVEFGPADSSTVFFDTTAPTTDGLMINRPCGDRRLSECLFRVMRLGNFIVFVPGEDAPWVLSEATVVHLPADMLECLGPPIVAPDLESFVLAFNSPAGLA